MFQKKGVPDACTIHSLLYYPQKDENGKLIGWVKRDESAADLADLIVLDECSMIGDDIAADIKALNRKVLVIGDPGQLPPINRDSGFHTDKPDAFLEEIHRQAADNPIIRLAMMVREGRELPIKFSEDECWIAPLDYETREAIFRQDTQVICGTHQSRYNYTKSIRERYGIGGEIPIAGEPVICCKTNYIHHFFNGYIGNMGEMQIIGEKLIDGNGSEYHRDEWYCDFIMDDLDEPRYRVLTDPYLFKNHYSGQGKIEPLADNIKNYGRYSEFDWAYIITCHKAQGSSFEDVTIIDDSAVFRKDAAKWLYTALTRAEKHVTLLRRKYR